MVKKLADEFDEVYSCLSRVDTEQMVAGLGAVLNGANLYGYVRCKMGSPKKLTGAASNFLGQQVLGSVRAQHILCLCSIFPSWFKTSHHPMLHMH